MKLCALRSGSSWLSTRFAITFFTGVLLISGCSGSGGSSTADEVGVVGQNTVAPNTSDDLDTDIPVSAASDADEASSTANNLPLSGDEGPLENVADSNSVDASGGATDTAQQEAQPEIATRVDFEITVPAYMSNSLSIEVKWGSKHLWANWVGDEYWTASDIFPTNVTHPLVVTFMDRNGHVVLASYEKEFTTGTNAAEIYPIVAQQFDSNKWDDDGDSVSNLNESKAGTNPLIVEVDQLEIRDSYYKGQGVIGYQIKEYEEMIPAFPYYVHFEDITPLTWNEDYSNYTRGLSEILTTDIDENGTGSFYDYYKYSEPSNVTVEDQGATRTNTGNSIVYTATYVRTNSSAGVRREYDINLETKAIDGLTRTQTGTIHDHSTGYSDSNTTDRAFTLTGKVGDDDLLCSPDYGTLTFERVYRYGENDFLKTTVNKDADDEYWNVSVTTEKGSVVEEYLVQSLGVDFVCNLMGLPIPAKSE